MDVETPPTGTPPEGTPPEQQPSASASARPEGIPDELWTDDKGFNAERFTQYRAPAADLPTAADAYALPKVEGVEIDEADPMLAVLRTTAFEQGLGQEAFAKTVTDYAKQLHEADSASYTSSMETLGGGAGKVKEGEARVEAVSRWLDAQLPAGEADALRAVTVTPEAIIGLERLMNKHAAPAPREGDLPPPPTRKTYDQIRDVMRSKEYSGKPHERSQAVIAEVEKWFQEEARAKADAAAGGVKK